MREKKNSEQAKPFFTRVYKKHRKMVKDLVKHFKQSDDEKSSAEVVRLGIEKLHAEVIKNDKK